ncbi:MAG: hypothetical protein R2809_13950 [Flavobacteriales bacterium]
MPQAFTWAGPFPVVLSQVVLTQVVTTSTHKLTLMMDHAECPPANDDCADAVAIGCGVTVSGTTINSNMDGVDDCLGIAQTSPGVWYTFIGTGDQVILSTCASAVDTKIQVFAGNCANLSCIAANEDDPNCAGFASTVVFTSLLLFSIMY